MAGTNHIPNAVGASMSTPLNLACNQTSPQSQPRSNSISSPSPSDQQQRIAAAHAAAFAAVSNPGLDVNTTADLAILFECPVCFDSVLPPIFQCEQGHLICTNCKPKVETCPSCRGPGWVRNLAMEKVAETVKFPCKYASSGCNLRMLHKAKRHHEDYCEYRPYSCPCPGTSCKWLGNLDLVLDHLLNAHKTITTLQGEDIVFLATDINLPGAVDWVMMQCCFEHYFMLVLEKQERHEGHQQFFAVVQIIGTEKQAETFRYKLELVGHGRKLIWEAKPRSIHEGIASVISSNDCLIFETAMAQHFGENGNLAINVTIFKSYF